MAVVLVLILAASGTYLYVSSRAGSKTGSTPTSASGCSVPNPVSAYLYACIDTTQGNMTVELFQSQTPQTVDNFVKLVDEGFYNHLVWHRIVQGFVIQTGDPNTRNGGGIEADWGDGGSNQTVPLEIVPGLNNNYGYLAMARGQSNNSGTSQFFINMADNSFLNGKYTVFGKVISGMSVAVAISDLPVNAQCQSSDDVTCQPLNPLDAMVLSITMINATSETTTSSG